MTIDRIITERAIPPRTPAFRPVLFTLPEVLDIRARLARRRARNTTTSTAERNHT